MSILDHPKSPKGPLLNLREATSALLVSAIIVAGLVRLFLRESEFNGHFREVALGLYFGGHTLLAAFVVKKGRLKLRFPIDRSWLDLLVIASAPWIGSFVWLQKWKKTNKTININKPHL